MVSNNLANDSTPEESLRALSADSRLKRLGELLTEFNLFDVLSVARSELQHSRVVAWLLDPNGSHGLGDAFLRGFLRQAALAANGVGIDTVTPTDIDGWNLGSAEVFLERHNIDILVIDESNGFVCLIENKIGSGEHSDQLSRYLGTVRRAYKTLTPFPVFLTPSGIHPAKAQDAEEYAPLGYEIISNLISEILETVDTDIRASVADFLKQYELTLRRRVLETPSDIDRLAYEIYNKHRRAIDLVLRARSNLSTVNWDIIESAVRRFAPDLKKVSRATRILTYTSRSLEEVSELQDGDRLVVVDFLYHDESVRLRLMVGPEHQETRDRLYRLAPTETYDPSESQDARGRNFRLYWKRFLNTEECNPFEPELTRAKAEEGIKAFYQQDYWLLVNAIRGEFNLSPVKQQADS